MKLSIKIINKTLSITLSIPHSIYRFMKTSEQLFMIGTSFFCILSYTDACMYVYWRVERLPPSFLSVTLTNCNKTSLSSIFSSESSAFIIIHKSYSDNQLTWWQETRTSEHVYRFKSWITFMSEKFSINTTSHPFPWNKMFQEININVIVQILYELNIKFSNYLISIGLNLFFILCIIPACLSLPPFWKFKKIPLFG